MADGLPDVMCAGRNDPVKQGQLLRAALAEHNRFALKTSQIERWGKNWFIDINKIVKQYVPEGCTFDYAEKVLTSAGFDLSPHRTPNSPPGLGGEYEFDVEGWLRPGGEPSVGLTCIVALRPAGPYDYSLVHRVLTTCGATLLGDPRETRTGLIEDVSDLAFMNAAYRAIETTRADAFFHDPLAAKLAGLHGEKIVQNRPKWSLIGQWLVALRTRIIDEFIRNAIAQETVTILNLGAALDTRPYRMVLPAHIRWIEIDNPNIIEFKERLLSGEKPRCDLERIKLDLTDIPARRRLFAQIAGKSEKTLVLTEGVIPYLDTEDVASLADDLRGHAEFRYWIVDYSSPEARRFRLSAARRMRMQNVPFLFEPDDYFGFFRKHGWQAEEIRYVPEEAQKLNRPFPLPLQWRWWIGLLSFLTGGPSRRALLKSTAYVMLQPSESH